MKPSMFAAIEQDSLWIYTDTFVPDPWETARATAISTFVNFTTPECYLRFAPEDRFATLPGVATGQDNMAQKDSVGESGQCGRMTPQ